MRSHCWSLFSRASLAGLVLTIASSSALAQGAQPKGQPAPPPAGSAPAPGKAAPAPGKAQPPAKPKPKLTGKKAEEEAGRLFKEGKDKFNAGDFQGAYEAFKAADELAPSPVPKYRMGESLDKKGDIDGAIAAYEAFLASKTDPEKDKERIANANARITALKATPADVKVTIQPPEAAAATLSIDGAPATGNPVKVPPGKHTITATLEGFEDGKVEVDVARSEKKDVTITLTAKPKEVAGPGPGPGPEKPPTEKPKTEPASSSSSLIPAIVTLSLAGAGVVVGSVFGGLALKSKSEYEDTPTQDLFDETERNALIADMSFGVALTFGVTGVVLLLTDTGAPEPEGEKKAKLDFILPYASPDGAGAVGRVSF
ncbi:MAG: PEGA domain-containing protein [Polyangiaceae bacterium]|nr:PEGA domain-containing protein [Polyangiaceae bacterium]